MMHNRPELKQTMRTPTSPSNEGKNKAEGEYLSHVWFLSWERENGKKTRSKRKELQTWPREPLSSRLSLPHTKKKDKNETKIEK